MQGYRRTSTKRRRMLRNLADGSCGVYSCLQAYMILHGVHPRHAEIAFSGKKSPVISSLVRLCRAATARAGDPANNPARGVQSDSVGGEWVNRGKFGRHDSEPSSSGKWGETILNEGGEDDPARGWYDKQALMCLLGCLGIEKRVRLVVKEHDLYKDIGSTPAPVHDQVEIEWVNGCHFGVVVSREDYYRVNSSALDPEAPMHACAATCAPLLDLMAATIALDGLSVQGPSPGGAPSESYRVETGTDAMRDEGVAAPEMDQEGGGCGASASVRASSRPTSTRPRSGTDRHTKSCELRRDKQGHCCRYDYRRFLQRRGGWGLYETRRGGRRSEHVMSEVAPIGFRSKYGQRCGRECAAVTGGALNSGGSEPTSGLGSIDGRRRRSTSRPSKSESPREEILQDVGDNLRDHALDEELDLTEQGKRGYTWGREYNPGNTRFDLGVKGESRFYRDEAWDVLVGDEEGYPIYPHRLKTRSKLTRVLKEFRNNVFRSWKVVRDDIDGEIVLLHEVKAGKNRDGVGERTSKRGWKIVPTKEHILPIILQLHQHFHFGRDRALEILNQTYSIPNTTAKAELARVKGQCSACSTKGDKPPNPPATPITSMDFGERVLVDLKQLMHGFMIVAICHWSNYCWLGYLEDKRADGVAEFLIEVFKSISGVRGSWPNTHEESKKLTKGGVSFPVNRGEVKTEVPDAVYNFSLAEDHSSDHLLKDLDRLLEQRHRVLQHDRGREFNNKTVKGLAEQEGFVVRRSKAYCPRENGKAESKVKNAYKTFSTEIDKFEGEKHSSTTMKQKAIASAQAIENLAVHAKSRATPYEAAYRREAVVETDDENMTYLRPGEALPKFRVLAMIHQIQMRQFTSAQRMVDRAYEQTRTQRARSKELKVGQTVTFFHRARETRVPNKGIMEGKITALQRSDDSEAPSAVYVETTTDGQKKEWRLKPTEIRMPPSVDPEIAGLMRDFSAKKKAIPRPNQRQSHGTNPQKASQTVSSVARTQDDPRTVSRPRAGSDQGSPGTPRRNKKPREDKVDQGLASRSFIARQKPTPDHARPRADPSGRSPFTLGHSPTFSLRRNYLHASLEDSACRVERAPGFRLKCNYLRSESGAPGVSLGGFYLPPDNRSVMNEGYSPPGPRTPAFHLIHNYLKPDDESSSPEAEPGFRLQRGLWSTGNARGTAHHDLLPQTMDEAKIIPAPTGDDTQQSIGATHDRGTPVRDENDDERGASSGLAPLMMAHAGLRAGASGPEGPTSLGLAKGSDWGSEFRSAAGDAPGAWEDGVSWSDDTDQRAEGSIRDDNQGTRGGLASTKTTPAETRCKGDKWLVCNYNGGSYFNSLNALLLSRGEIIGDVEPGPDLTPRARNYFEHLSHLKANMSTTLGQPRQMKKRNDVARKEVLQGWRGIDHESVQLKSPTPLAVLEGLAATNLSASPGEKPTTHQLRTTRGVLGVSTVSFEVQPGQCPHGGQMATVENPGKVEERPTVLDLKLEIGHAGDIQSLLNDLPTAGRRPCPFCGLDPRSPETRGAKANPKGKDVDVVYKWSIGRPSMFLARLVGKGLVPSFSMSPGVEHSLCVELFGDAYSLCGVIYRTRSGSDYQYSSQVALDGTWWTYTDLEGGRLKNVGQFEEDFLSGSEYMLMFISAKAVAKRYGKVETHLELAPFRAEEEEDAEGRTEAKGDGPPPLLTKLQALKIRSNEIYNPVRTSEQYNARLRHADFATECYSATLLPSASRKYCFANSLAFAIMAVWDNRKTPPPKKEDLTAAARPFFGAVAELYFSNAGAGDYTYIEIQEMLGNAADGALLEGGTYRRSPAALLNCIVKNSGNCRATPAQIRETRTAIGVDNPLHVVEGCEIHYGDPISFPQKVVDAACNAPTVFEIPVRPARRTVQDEIDAHALAWELGMYSRHSQSGPCPLCPTPSAPNATVAQGIFDGRPPAHFFVSVERMSKDEEAEPGTYGRTLPSPCVSAYSKTYRLCAVIFQMTWGPRSFLCQALYRGCWWTYDSSSGGAAEHCHKYEPNPFKTKGVRPVFFAYVREDDIDNCRWRANAVELSQQGVLIEEQIACTDAARLALEKAVDEKRKEVNRSRKKEASETESRKWARCSEADVLRAYATLPSTLPWQTNSNSTTSELSKKLVLAFLRSGYASWESLKKDSDESGDTPRPPSPGGRIVDGTCKETDVQQAIRAELNPYSESWNHFSSMEKRRSKRSTDLQYLARRLAGVWTSMILDGMFVRFNEPAADEALSRGFPRDILKITVDSVPDFRWTPDARQIWKKLLLGQPLPIAYLSGRVFEPWIAKPLSN